MTATKEFTYDTTASAACCTSIHVALADGIIQSIEIHDGCDGNHQGIAALVKGMTAAEAIRRLEGIDCEARGTSCPDQLSKALKAALAQ